MSCSFLTRSRFIKQGNNYSLCAVLEKVASLNDREEVARLAGEAEGKKFSVEIQSAAFQSLKKCPNSPFSDKC